MVVLITGCTSPTPLKPIVEKNKTVGWEGAQKELVLQPGQSFTYWMTWTQEWINFTYVKSEQGTPIIDRPMIMSLTYDPYAGAYVMSTGGASMFWVDINTDGSIRVYDTTQPRLRLLK